MSLRISNRYVRMPIRVRGIYRTSPELYPMCTRGGRRQA